MSIIDQIVNLDHVARMGGTELDRYHMSPPEFMRMQLHISPERFPEPPKAGMVGFIYGVAIIVVEAKA